MRIKRQAGFTFSELFIAFIILAVLGGIVISLASGLYDLIGDWRSRVLAEKLRDSIERYYYIDYARINSGLQIILPNGCELRSQGDYIPKYVTVPCIRGGLEYFVNEPYDYREANYRILISPLLSNDKFHYRNFYIVYTKGGRREVLSTINSDGEINCHPQEICYKVDGERITEEIYNQVEREVDYVVGTLNSYALTRYTADATKNPLIYRFANSNSRGGNISNCDLPECYYDSGSVIQNSCNNPAIIQAGRFNLKHRPQVELSSLSPYDTNVNFMSVHDVAPTLFDRQYSHIYIANCGRPGSTYPRVPENTPITQFGGWNAIVISCISTKDCIKRIVNQ